MRQTTLGIILVFVGAAIAAIGVVSFSGRLDDLKWIAIVFVLVSRDLGLGFLIGIMMVPTGDLYIVYAGVAAGVLGGILCAAD
ncbi:MAG: hypothetical protein ACFFCM_08585 [Promethearchaeota archaeon]